MRLRVKYSKYYSVKYFPFPWPGISYTDITNRGTGELRLHLCDNDGRQMIDIQIHKQ